MPSVAWAPLSAVAVGSTLWGLKVGAQQHGRGEPLAVEVSMELAATLPPEFM